MKRTGLTILASCLSLFFCGPASAQHSGPYVGAFVGGSSLLTTKASNSLGNFSISFDPNLTGSAVAGWDFEPGNPLGEGRIELEYTRRSNTVDQMKFVEGSFKGGGKVTSDSLLVNFFGVFHDAGRWAPYAGVGAGVARMEASSLQVGGNPMGSGSSVVLAYQLGAGLDVALTNYLNLDLGYRFFGSSKPSFTEVSGRKFDMNYFSHNAVLGLRVGL